MKWSRVDVTAEVNETRYAELAESLMLQGGIVHLRHDVSWALREHAHRDDAVAYAESDGNGLAVLLRRQRPLKFQVGEVALAKLPLRRLDLWQQPAIKYASDSADAVAATASLFITIADDLRPGEAVGIEGCPIDGPVAKALARDDVQKRYISMQQGAAFKHQFIDMPPTFDEYLKTLSKRSRKSIAYSVRKLHKDFNDAVRIESIETLQSLDRFLKDATEVSRKTYQWNLLGLGLRDHDELRRRFSFACEKGWFRSYLLYVEDRPVAFIVGYHYRDVYFYLDVGFDRDMGKWSVGSVLQWMMLEDLYDSGRPPRLFDFSTGTGPHKARYSNTEVEEVNFLLLPRTLKNRLACSAHKALEASADSAIGMLDRLGLKKRIKRAIRDRSIKSD